MIPVKHYSTVSTLLVSSHLIREYPFVESLKGKKLKQFLHMLLTDPFLDAKLANLRASKWKKHYQAEGLDLVRINFIPDEADWARLSIISNGTGFSRCYIFVFLLMYYLGIYKLEKNGTPFLKSKDALNSDQECTIRLDKSEILLIRKLKIPWIRNPKP